MTNTEAMAEHLVNTLNLPQSAAEWLMMLWNAIQVFDDVADEDAIERQDLDAVIWNTLVAMPQNQFFAAHSSILLPIVSTMILKWQASDRIERDGKADAKSYMWRAGYYDVILIVVQLCHGVKLATENAHIVMEMYGETFAEYKKEFDNA